MNPAAFVADLLGRPAAAIAECREPRAQLRAVATCLVLIAMGGVAFGAAIGSYRGGAQIAYAALKVPIATLGALAVCGPGFAGFAAAFGFRWTLRDTLALALAAGARSGLVLFALTPVVWMAIDLGAGYHAVRLGAAAAYGLAGLSALGLLLRGLCDAPGRVGAATSFVALFLVAGAQTAWLLRPYLGDPRDREVPVFAQGRIEGGVLGALRRSAADGGEGARR